MDARGWTNNEHQFPLSGVRGAECRLLCLVKEQSIYEISEIEGRLTTKLSRQPVRRLAGLARSLRLARSVTKGMVGFSALLGGPEELAIRVDHILERPAERRRRSMRGR